MGAYEKARLGWIEEMDAGTAGSAQFTLPPVQSVGQVAARSRCAAATSTCCWSTAPTPATTAGSPPAACCCTTWSPRVRCAPAPPARACTTSALVEADGNGALVRTAAGGRQPRRGGRRVHRHAPPDGRHHPFAAAELRRGRPTWCSTSPSRAGRRGCTCCAAAAIPPARMLGPYLGGAALTRRRAGGGWTRSATPTGASTWATCAPTFATCPWRSNPPALQQIRPHTESTEFDLRWLRCSFRPIRHSEGGAARNRPPPHTLAPTEESTFGSVVA